MQPTIAIFLLKVSVSLLPSSVMTVAEYLISVTSRYDILHHLHPVFVFHRVALFYS